MGCPRLTYHQNPSPLTVVYSAKSRHQKIGANVLYFGARYYDSEVSVWLSVDPLADKYPSMSPYMYTAGNPVMLVDPNGMETIARRDEWEINSKTGDVTWKKKSDKHVLYAVDGKGKRTGNSVAVSNSDVLNQLLKDDNKYAGSNYYTYRFADVSGDKQGNTDDIFKTFLFCAQNRSIEWNLYRYKKGGQNRYWIGSFSFNTIIGPYGENHSPSALHSIKNIISEIHSHPYSNRRRKLKDAFYGMGYNMENNKYLVNSDVGNVHDGIINHSSYVYDVTQNSIYHLSPESIIPIEIKKVKGYRSFYFGVLNHK